MNILVIVAQGGGIGRQLVLSIKQALPDVEVPAVGTNAAATAAMLNAGVFSAAMLNAGVFSAATGENAVVCVGKANIIVGPIGIVTADYVLGEITPKMALAVAQSGAVRVLIPFSHCDNVIAGAEKANTAELIQKAVTEVQKPAGHLDKCCIGAL